jgi:hypothetical protein
MIPELSAAIEHAAQVCNISVKVQYPSTPARSQGSDQ